MPELWQNAAGLCARVRACSGAAESLHTYTHKALFGLRVRVNPRVLVPPNLYIHTHIKVYYQYIPAYLPLALLLLYTVVYIYPTALSLIPLWYLKCTYPP